MPLYVFSGMVGMARCAIPARVVAGGANTRATLAIGAGTSPSAAATEENLASRMRAQRSMPTGCGRGRPLSELRSALGADIAARRPHHAKHIHAPGKPSQSSPASRKGTLELRPQRLPQRLPPEGGDPGTPPSGGRWIAQPAEPLAIALANSERCLQAAGGLRNAANRLSGPQNCGD